jgi:aminoglycoside phosphotransferase (APT) family kinase protein
LRDAEFERARPRLARQCGEIAAAIHATDVATLPELPVLDAAAQLDQYRSLLDALGEPHPALELGLRWLGERVPPHSAPPRPTGVM